MIDTTGTILTGRVTTEGDELFYEMRGAGQALLMIPPAGGDGWQYSLVADILSDEYKVICYDRRANARSTMNTPQNFEISQQSRDALAVLQAAGENSAYIFGNSSGAVIALDFARNHPAATRAAIVHEAPLARLTPEARKWQRFFAKVNLTAYRYNSSLAALQFMFGAKLPVFKLMKATKPINRHKAKSQIPYMNSRQAMEVLTKMELLPVTNYQPDLATIKKNGVRVIVGVSEWGLVHETWYVKACAQLAEQLGCELVTFPGHHGSFMDLPETWAGKLRGVLHKAEQLNLPRV